MTTNAQMSAEEMVALTKKHSFFSWSAQEAVNPIPMAKAKGVYFWDANGKRYFDLNSQLMCVRD
ncbi:MAG: gabT [Anaerolineales bacterium]|nr:gabT [Anaerolineales bacterium]